MKKIRLICPACKKSHPLALKSEKSVLLLNCPECRAILLHYGDATYQVEKSEIKDLSQKKNLKSVYALLELISRKEGKRQRGKAVLFKPQKLSLSKAQGKPMRTEPIGQDEVLDLIIELQTSASVTDFLEKLK
jgi:Zn-finger nucleic acid-binding protein